MFAGSDGVEWCEPQSFKGRMGTSMPGQRFRRLREMLDAHMRFQIPVGVAFACAAMAHQKRTAIDPPSVHAQSREDALS